MKYYVGQRFFSVYANCYVTVTMAGPDRFGNQYAFQIGDNPNAVGCLHEYNIDTCLIEGLLIDHNTSIKPLKYIKGLKMI